MLQEYWISHSILRTKGMRKYIIFLVILACSSSTVYAPYLYYSLANLMASSCPASCLDKAMRQ